MASSVDDSMDGGVPPHEAHEDAPTCYRHPERETHIQCARCERPICGDCMIPASVGFQCPPCVRGARKEAPAQRTVLGGRITLRPGVVTLALIGVNVLVFLLVRTQSIGFLSRMLNIGDARIAPDGTLLYAWAPFGQAVGVAHGEWWRLLTGTFTHQAVWHIVVNMFALYNIGTIMEHLLGRARFLALYLVCGVAASATTFLFAPDTPSLGASGAIMGLAGAAVVIFRRLRYDAGPLLLSILITLALPWFVPNVDWRAHLGGLIIGAVLGAVLAYAPRARRLPVTVGSFVAVLAVVVVAVVIRTSMLT